ncbi:MAG: acyl CoA:acetate/3-ketoacid CoA transferase [SAR324 cluster bacterium]|nr:acyl CoA:acetate/3-ketoacid CoA transferase [SAR324 cluster bacterium]
MHNVPTSPSVANRSKLVSVEEAVQLIQDGNTVATGGFVGIGFAEEVAKGLEDYYNRYGSPKNLTLLYAAGQGDGKEKGLNHFAYEGLVSRVIGGHWGLVPKLQKLAIDNKIEAYNFPQGVITHMFRDTAAHKPYTISRVGLSTFVDPRNGGGKINASTTRDLVELTEVAGKEYLLYQTIPVDVAIIRGTTADSHGNITMEKEALTLEALSIATAAKNSGGIVIVQVEQIAELGALNPRHVKIPGIMVDCVVLSRPENHWQTFGTEFDAAFAGQIRVPLTQFSPMPLNERKITARRAASELRINDIVNLGIGSPEGVANVANEENILEYITLTTEPGVIGGVPAGGLDFGAAANTEAIIDQPNQFDFYDGGGLDIAVLGLAQADQYGNVNVSKFGPKLAGAGGFINISQNTKKIVFTGSLTASGLKVAVEDGKLRIVQEGKVKKLIQQVEHVTFSGHHAMQQQQSVLYVTERCVFQLTSKGMELIEIAPGIDVDKDIRGNMDFTPLIREPLQTMDPRIFADDPMGLRSNFLGIPLGDRFTYDSEKSRLYVNFEGLSITDKQQVHEIKDYVEQMVKENGKNTYAIINYDNFNILPDLLNPYMEMVRNLEKNYYKQVTRYSSNSFLRMKLVDVLGDSDARVFDSKTSAENAMSKGR